MDSTLIEAHLPCPDCGSHDALSLYDDGHTYCFSCGKITQDANKDKQETAQKVKVGKGVIEPANLYFEPLPVRKITEATCRHFNYYKGFIHGKKAQIACYYDAFGTLTGQKVRYADKSFEVLGKIEDRFFGQQLYESGGALKLVITEGEIDALTVSQIQGNKYPVVSLPKGANGAKRVFEAQYDWLESFDEVIVMFDNDRAGQEAVQSVCGILSPGKLKIASLPMKDPNECLCNDKAQAVLQAIWNAKVYKPACIINGNELWDLLSTDNDNEQGYPLPWNIPMQDMTMGIRKGELIIITAGTGVGKTTFTRQLAHHLGVSLHLKVGMMMLEENVKRTAKGLLSIHTGKRLALNRHLISDEEYKKAYDETLGSGHYIFYEHFGSLESEDLIKSIRYMTVAEKCDFIILDHISIAISGLEIENERKATDVLMTRLRSLVEETGVGMIVVSHLKRIDAQPAEEGGAISLAHLRGSQALGQLSDGVWALERNQQEEDEKKKNVVRIRILKGRMTGETGIAGYLSYNKDTDRLEAISNIKEYTKQEAVYLDTDTDIQNSPF